MEEGEEDDAGDSEKDGENGVGDVEDGAGDVEEDVVDVCYGSDTAVDGEMCIKNAED